MDHPIWNVLVIFMDGKETTINGAHRVRYDGEWLIVERYDGTYDDIGSLRAWSFYGSNVREVFQL